MFRRMIPKLESLKANKSAGRVLLIGGNGQIGEALLEPLNFLYGEDKVLVTDQAPSGNGPNYLQLDAMDRSAMHRVFQDFKPDLVFHLVALLSGTIFFNCKTPLRLVSGSYAQF